MSIGDFYDFFFQNQWNFRLCGVFLIDSHFMVDGGKFLSGSMAALSCMINLELSHINILSKVGVANFKLKDGLCWLYGMLQKFLKNCRSIC